MDSKKNYINYARVAEPKTGVYFSDFIKMILKNKARRMGESYNNNYKTLIYHINNFSAKYNVDLFTNSINEEFLDDFIIYLESIGLKKTYIRNILDLVKAMVRKAAVYGYVIDITYDNVEIGSEEVQTIYLSQNEIARIYYFPNLTKRQEKIRDLFIVGCYTALRYSDLNTLKKEDIQNGYITKITKKSKTRVVIPIHDFVNEIIEKYDGFPNGVCSQHFNRYIKLICKKIGINDKINISYTKGGSIVTETKEKWEMVSSHTSRRSGATNLFKTGRMRVVDIMRLTGHSSERSFMRYVRTTNQDTAREMAGDDFFKK